MSKWEAPAKVNLTLHVQPPRSDGYHPLESLVQTVEWYDTLTFAQGDGEDSLDVQDVFMDREDNLVLKALSAVRGVTDLSPQRIHLEKVIPVGAGLGGGSSDAAATLMAAAEIAGLGDVSGLAADLGADVPLFLTGGTLLMSGIGEVIDREEPLHGFAVAIAVPEFELATAEVYRRWDELEGPVGELVSDALLPPPLRDGMPIRNDLTPAALSLEPQLGDFMADLRSEWNGVVCMTGSGSGCFGYFGTVGEAVDAAGAVSHLASVAVGVEVRDRGVARVEAPPHSAR